MTTDYLAMKEKVVMVKSRAEVVEVESSKLRKDLIKTMDRANEAKDKLKEKVVMVNLRAEVVTSFSFGKFQFPVVPSITFGKFFKSLSSYGGGQ